MIDVHQTIDREQGTMREADISQPALFITRTVEDYVPTHHPLRTIRRLIHEVLPDQDVQFNRLYSDKGRESVTPERLACGSSF